MTRREFGAKAGAAAVAALAVPCLHGVAEAAKQVEAVPVDATPEFGTVSTYVSIHASAFPADGTYALQVGDEYGTAVSVRGNGTVEFREGLSIDDASRKFWEGVSLLIRKNSSEKWPVPAAVAAGLS